MRRFLAAAAFALAARPGAAGPRSPIPPERDDRFAGRRSVEGSGGAEAVGGPFTPVFRSCLLPGYLHPSMPHGMPGRWISLKRWEFPRRRSSSPPVPSRYARCDGDVAGDFVAFMHPKIVGLTGSAGQARAAARVCRVYFRKPNGGGEFRRVDRSALPCLMLPGQGVLTFFRREIDAGETAMTAIGFVKAAGQV